MGDWCGQAMTANQKERSDGCGKGNRENPGWHRVSPCKRTQFLKKGVFSCQVPFNGCPLMGNSECGTMIGGRPTLSDILEITPIDKRVPQ